MPIIERKRSVTHWLVNGTFAVLMCLIVLLPALLFGRFLLDMLGILSYGPPMNQDAENAVRVELVDTSDAPIHTVLRLLEGSEMEVFLADFGKLRAKRYANDPPSPYGDIMVAIYYEDGHVDRIGNRMNEYFSPSGESLPAGGWYHFPDGKLEALFDKYTQ